MLNRFCRVGASIASAMSGALARVEAVMLGGSPLGSETLEPS